MRSMFDFVFFHLDPVKYWTQISFGGKIRHTKVFEGTLWITHMSSEGTSIAQEASHGSCRRWFNKGPIPRTLLLALMGHHVFYLLSLSVTGCLQHLTASPNRRLCTYNWGKSQFSSRRKSNLYSWNGISNDHTVACITLFNVGQCSHMRVFPKSNTCIFHLMTLTI